MTITITNQPVVLKHAAAAFGIAGTAALAAKAVARIAQNQNPGSEATRALNTKVFRAASATSSKSAHIAVALVIVLART
jgi:hypothetical protein